MNVHFSRLQAIELLIGTLVERRRQLLTALDSPVDDFGEGAMEYFNRRAAEISGQLAARLYAARQLPQANRSSRVELALDGQQRRPELRDHRRPRRAGHRRLSAMHEQDYIVFEVVSTGPGEEDFSFEPSEEAEEQPTAVWRSSHSRAEDAAEARRARRSRGGAAPTSSSSPSRSPTSRAAGRRRHVGRRGGAGDGKPVHRQGRQGRSARHRHRRGPSGVRRAQGDREGLHRRGRRRHERPRDALRGHDRGAGRRRRALRRRPGDRRSCSSARSSASRGGRRRRSSSAMVWALDNGANVLSMSLGIDFPGLVDRLTAEA